MKRIYFSVGVLACFVVLYFSHVQTFPILPEEGLDPSFILALDWATGARLNHGIDVIYTYGPMYYLFISQSACTHFVQTAFWTVLFLSTIVLACKDGSFSVLFKICVVVICFFYVHIADFAYVLPVIFILAVQHKKSRRSYIGIYSLLLACSGAAFTLAKSVYFFIWLPAVLIGDISCMHKNKAPWYSIVYIASTLVFYVASGNTLSSFLEFCASALSVSLGHSEAMISWEPFPVASFVSYVVLCTLVVGYGCSLLFSLKNGKLSNILSLLVLVAALFLAFKQSYVRHDVYHVYYAHEVTLAAACVLFLFGSNVVWTSRLRRMLFNAAGLLLMALCISSVAIHHNLPYQGRDTDKDWRLEAPFLSFKDNIYLFLSGFGSLTETMKASKAKALASIAFRFPLGRIEGTVDIYPGGQALVIANNLKYCPRPVIQSFQAYTLKLLTRNKDFLHSPRAPEFILLDISSIDFRYPALMDAPSWLTFLSWYNVVDKRLDYLLLARQPRPRSLHLQPLHAGRWDFGQPLHLPTEKDVLWASIRFDYSLLGRITKLLWRPPRIVLNVAFDDGATKKYVLIPGIAECGFLLSPYVSNTEEYSRLHFKDLGTMRHVSSIMISPDYNGLDFLNGLALRMYSNIAIELHRVIY